MDGDHHGGDRPEPLILTRAPGASGLPPSPAPLVTACPWCPAIVPDAVHRPSPRRHRRHRPDVGTAASQPWSRRPGPGGAGPGNRNRPRHRTRGRSSGKAPQSFLCTAPGPSSCTRPGPDHTGLGDTAQRPGCPAALLWLSPYCPACPASTQRRRRPAQPPTGATTTPSRPPGEPPPAAARPRPPSVRTLSHSPETQTPGPGTLPPCHLCPVGTRPQIFRLQRFYPPGTLV